MMEALLEDKYDVLTQYLESFGGRIAVSKWHVVRYFH